MIKYFTIEDLLKHYLQKKFHILAAALKSVNKEATSTPRQIQLPQGLSYIPYSFLCPT